MREIKFKGIKKSDGQWITGDLNHIDGEAFIFNRSDTELNSTDDYEVYPETVGQYTGLKDKNGVDIYEGDEVEIQVTKGVVHKGVVVFNHGTFCLKSKADLGKDRYNLIPFINYASSCIITKKK